MQDNLRKLKKRTGEGSDSDSDDEARRKRRAGPSYLEQELSKYAKNRGRAVARAANSKRKREEEDDLLAEMSRFSQKVVAENFNAPRKAIIEDEDEAGPTQDVDDDSGWMNHDLRFKVDEKELTRRAEDEYAVSCDPTQGSGADFKVIDPRAKARELVGKGKHDRTNKH